VTAVIHPPDEPEAANGSIQKWSVVTSAPIEFLGSIIGELTALGGSIQAINTPGEEVEVRALLPASEFESMAKFLVDLQVRPPARIEREP
jgi:hypothetical protein